MFGQCYRYIPTYTDPYRSLPPRFQYGNRYAFFRLPPVLPIAFFAHKVSLSRANTVAKDSLAFSSANATSHAAIKMASSGV